MNGEGYFTLKSAAEARFTERKSEFIGNASPVKTEREALDFINSVRSKYSDATHNVYAYILRDGNLARFSDDGEPHGTAGLPTMDVLRKEGLCDCAVVVTRYFGGILLGAGGLVRAYTAGAKAAVDAAVKIRMKPFDIMEFRLDYSRYSRAAQLMSVHRVYVTDSNFAEDVYIKCRAPQDRAAAFAESLREATNASVELHVCGVEYDYEED